MPKKRRSLSNKNSPRAYKASFWYKKFCSKEHGFKPGKILCNLFGKSLGTKASLVVLAIFFSIGLVLGGALLSPTGLIATSSYTVTSVISDENIGPTYGFFLVPNGRVAYEVAGRASRATGWGIYKATIKNNRPALVSYVPVYHTSYGLNRVLHLSQGAYIVMVDGSKGASVVVEYKLK